MPAERLYYEDSSLAAFSAVVTDIRERSRTGGASLWQIALDRTAFYPTSGGQPHDTGLLHASAPSGTRIEIPIVEVDEDEQGEVWHLTPKPLLAGTAIDAHIDWPRRLDHMQQHSGQHLLSALFDRELSARTVSFHLGESTSTVDLSIESVPPAQLAHIERLANEVIAEARPMSQHTVSGDEAERLLAEGKLRKLPPRGGSIRLVTIPELDLNACGGTHVGSTSRIGTLLIRGTERVRQTTRVTFVCGGRALAAAHADDTVLAELSRELSVGRADVVSAVARIKAESRTLAKEQKRLSDDLANYHAARLVVEDPLQNNLRIVIRSFADRDAEYVKLLASRVVLAAPHTIALLASTQAAPATVVAAASADLGKDANHLLRPALTAAGGRGGGSATLAQGQVVAEKISGLFEAIEAELRAGH